MWGIFVGLGLGVFQVFLLRKTAQWITSDKKKGTAIAVPIILLKLLIILGTLYLLATVSIPTMLWGAGGILIAMISIPIIINIREAKRLKEKEDDTNGTA